MVLVGDTAVGKTCLITSFLSNTFAENYEPTVLDVYKGEKQIRISEEDTINLHCEIHDTSGDDNLNNQRKVLYKGTDVFMICVAVNSKASFDNIEKWRKEIVSIEIDKPIVLLLTKSDMEEK